MTDHRMGWPGLAAMIAAAFPLPSRPAPRGIPRAPIDQAARAALDRDPARPRRMRLTAEAQADRDEFERLSWNRGCTCFVSPPCSFCMHPGHPLNLEGDETAWEPDVEGAGR